MMRYVFRRVLPEKLSSVLSQVIKIVNNIRGRALNSRLFKLLCEDFGSDYKVPYSFIMLMYAGSHGGMLLNECLNYVMNYFSFFDVLNLTPVKISLLH